jgi:hypothetical protein
MRFPLLWAFLTCGCAAGAHPSSYPHAPATEAPAARATTAATASPATASPLPSWLSPTVGGRKGETPLERLSNAPGFGAIRGGFSSTLTEDARDLSLLVKSKNPKAIVARLAKATSAGKAWLLLALQIIDETAITNTFQEALARPEVEGSAETPITEDFLEGCMSGSSERKFGQVVTELRERKYVFIARVLREEE